jgi:hypothetical protein
MSSLRQLSTLLRLSAAVLAVVLLAVPAIDANMHEHMTNTFKGAKVNAGTVTHSTENGRMHLTLSDDFVPPDTPDPHWQVVDSKGNVFMLQRLMIKENKVNKSITLPADVKDVARVQIWCAFAETLLGEASFPKPVR